MNYEGESASELANEIHRVETELNSVRREMHRTSEPLILRDLSSSERFLSEELERLKRKYSKALAANIKG